MKHHRVRRTALVALAMAFLAAAWAWDGLAAIGRRVSALIPWERFKAAFAAVIDRLPAPLVLLVFLVPFLIVEPLLVVATIAVAMGYVFWGAVAWIGLKMLAIAVLPAIFDLTKHRLMTMPWFVWAFDKLMAFHHYADRIVAPDGRDAHAAHPRDRTVGGALRHALLPPSRRRRPSFAQSWRVTGGRSGRRHGSPRKRTGCASSC